jgi:hypothetical protein
MCDMCDQEQKIPYGIENPQWICKYCGENEAPCCPQCVREDGKPVTDELVRD